MKGTVKRFIDDIQRSPWSRQEENLRPLERLTHRFVKIFWIASDDPFNKEILNHASALSYKFLLSLIPMLAMIFSVAKGFGIQDKVEPLLLQKTMGGEIASDLIPKIVEYVNNTNVTALGSVGLVFIVYTAISMLSQIENSFNRIWGITKPRTIIRKASDYLAILIIGPILLAVTLGLSTTLHSHAITQKLLAIGIFAGAMKLFFIAMPWISGILIVTLLFIIIPNTTVRFWPALAAGAISGSIWQLTQIAFLSFQIGLSKYNAIYGTFASVPIFMIWLHTSWVLVLFGGVLNHACQNVRTFHPMAFKNTIRFVNKEKICLAVLIAIGKRFDNGEGPSDAEGIAMQLGIAQSFVQNAMQRLLELGLILPLNGMEQERFVPARPASSIKISDFFTVIKGVAKEDIEFKDPSINTAVHEILSMRQDAICSSFSDRALSLPDEKA